MTAPRRVPALQTVALALAMCITLLHSPAQAKDVLRWRVTNWPPFYILKGDDKGKGLYDELITLMEEKMPEYEHQRVEMTTNRAQSEWAEGNNLCHPSVIPDDKSLHSSLNSILPTLRIVMRNDKTHLFKDDEIVLDDLLANPDLKGGVIPGRYTKTINQVVEKHKTQKHFIKYPVYNCQVKMLFEGRLDYIIEYPVIVNYTALKLAVDNDTKAFKIHETRSEPYISVVVGCTPNDWGEAMVEKINNILKEESQQPDFLDKRLQWYDEATRNELKAFYLQKYFKDKQ